MLQLHNQCMYLYDDFIYIYIYVVVYYYLQYINKFKI